MPMANIPQPMLMPAGPTAHPAYTPNMAQVTNTNLAAPMAPQAMQAHSARAPAGAGYYGSPNMQWPGGYSATTALSPSPQVTGPIQLSKKA